MITPQTHPHALPIFILLLFLLLLTFAQPTSSTPTRNLTISIPRHAQTFQQFTHQPTNPLAELQKYQREIMHKLERRQPPASNALTWPLWYSMHTPTRWEISAHIRLRLGDFSKAFYTACLGLYQEIVTSYTLAECSGYPQFDSAIADGPVAEYVASLDRMYQKLMQARAEPIWNDMPGLMEEAIEFSCFTNNWLTWLKVTCGSRPPFHTFDYLTGEIIKSLEIVSVNTNAAVKSGANRFIPFAINQLEITKRITDERIIAEVLAAGMQYLAALERLYWTWHHITDWEYALISLNLYFEDLSSVMEEVRHALEQMEPSFEDLRKQLLARGNVTKGINTRSDHHKGVL